MKIQNLTIEQIIKETGLPSPAKYDYIIVADGSGWQKDLACGWGGFIYNFWNKTREEFYGGHSGGTNNHAELAPFVYALSRLTDGMPYKIACVSDSEVTVKCGTGKYSNNINKIFWNGIRACGFEIEWFWIDRNSTNIHETCDTIGREIRFLFEAYERQIP